MRILQHVQLISGNTYVRVCYHLMHLIKCGLKGKQTRFLEIFKTGLRSVLERALGAAKTRHVVQPAVFVCTFSFPCFRPK